MARLWLLGAGMALALAACERGPEPADEAAACLNAREAEARIAACGVAAQDAALTPEQRSVALSTRGDAYDESGDVTAALRDYREALELDENNPSALLGQGRILVNSGQLDAAEPVLRRSIELNSSARANELMGRIALERGQYPDAIGFFNTALQHEGRSATAFAGRARAKQRANDIEGAAQDYSNAIQLDGDLAEARAGRCWLDLNEHREFARARSDADAAVAADPTNVEGQLCRGILQLRERQWDDAKVSFEAVLARDAGNTTALFGRGVARNRTGDRGGTRDMNQARDFESNISDRFADLGVNTY